MIQISTKTALILGGAAVACTAIWAFTSIQLAENARENSPFEVCRRAAMETTHITSNSAALYCATAHR